MKNLILHNLKLKWSTVLSVIYPTRTVAKVWASPMAKKQKLIYDTEMENVSRWSSSRDST